MADVPDGIVWTTKGESHAGVWRGLHLQVERRLNAGAVSYRVTIHKASAKTGTPAVGVAWLDGGSLASAKLVAATMAVAILTPGATYQ